MAKQNITLIISILCVLGIVAGCGILFVAQQLNSRTYEYAESLGKRQVQFEDAMSRISLPLLCLGLITMAGSGVVLLLSLRAGKGEDLKTGLLPLLDSCGLQRDLIDPMQSLQSAIGTMRIDLAEARKRERSIIERAVDVICIVDIHSKFISVSKACENAWGYTSKDLEGRSLTELIVSEDTNNILNSILGSAKSIDKIVFECKLKRKDERLLDVIWTAHWSASDGGLFCIVHDITERKYAELLLKNSERRLRRTLKNLPVGVLIVDTSGCVEFANAEALRMLRINTEQLRGTQLNSRISLTETLASSQLALSQPGSSTASSSAPSSPMSTPVQSASAHASSGQWSSSQLISSSSGQSSPNLEGQGPLEEKVKRSNGVATRFDGSTFPVEVSESIIDYGNEEKNIAVFLDKTAEHELEQVKREFMAMVTHEVKTPISSVYGIVALLETGALGQLTEKGVDLTRGVKATCKRVLRLVNDLLDLEKIQAGKFELACKSVSMRYAIESSFGNVQSLALEKRIEVEIPETDSSCWADEDRLVQVIVNLLGNAIKYSPEDSKITLTVDELPVHLKLSVSDRGRGIPEDKLNKIFGRYEQVDLTDSKKMGGSGLGLAISKAIVIEHGGEIGVTSTFGEGSTFWFTIPKTEPVVPN